MPEPSFLTNLTSLIGAAGGWVAGLGIGGGTLMTAYHALARNLNDDPQSVAHHTSSIRKVVVGTAIIAAAGGIATFAGGILK